MVLGLPDIGVREFLSEAFAISLTWPWFGFLLTCWITLPLGVLVGIGYERYTD